MDSCWLIEYKNGLKVILNEKQNQECQDKIRNDIKNNNVLVISHWFDRDICKLRNKVCIDLVEYVRLTQEGEG